MARRKVTIHRSELLAQLAAQGFPRIESVQNHELPSDLVFDVCEDCIRSEPATVTIIATREDQKTIAHASSHCPWLSTGDFIFPRGFGGTYRILSIEEE